MCKANPLPPFKGSVVNQTTHPRKWSLIDAEPVGKGAHQTRYRDGPPKLNFVRPVAATPLKQIPARASSLPWVRKGDLIHRHGRVFPHNTEQPTQQTSGWLRYFPERSD
jgi:hypothetical protein